MPTTEPWAPDVLVDPCSALEPEELEPEEESEPPEAPALEFECDADEPEECDSPWEAVALLTACDTALPPSEPPLPEDGRES